MFFKLTKSLYKLPLPLIRFSSSVNTYDRYKTMLITQPSEFVFHVEFNNPAKKNAMTEEVWTEIRSCFLQLNDDENCRSVVLSGQGNCFSSGIDLAVFAKIFSKFKSEDVSRRAFTLRKIIVEMQNNLMALEECLKPVIAVVHGACIGGALNLICHSDIRIASSNAWFQLKEIDLGLAPDVGAIQRMPQIMSSDSLVRELVYTGRKFDAKEAKSSGLVSDLIEETSGNANSLKRGLELASVIASKSPVAVQSAKAALLFSRNNPNVVMGARMQADWNQGMLQSVDLMKSVMAISTKQKPEYDKL